MMIRNYLNAVLNPSVTVFVVHMIITAVWILVSLRVFSIFKDTVSTQASSAVLIAITLVTLLAVGLTMVVTINRVRRIK